MGYTVRTFSQILQSLSAWILSHSPQITDMNPGSIIRSFCEATANSIEEVYIAVYLGFQRELQFLPQNVFDFQRKTGTKANASVIFTAAVAPGSNITIPIGTLVKTSSGLRFATTVVGTILTGNTTSGAVAVEAEKVGYVYNVNAHTILTLDTDINGVTSCDNALPATGGIDSESDYSFHNRFQQYFEGLGHTNKSGLITGALLQPSITSASVVELFPPVANVNVQLYVDDGSLSGVSAATVAAVQAIIDGDGTASNPGWRAAGVNVVVIASAIVAQNVTLVVTSTGQGADLNQIRTDVTNAITNYINGLGIGESLIFSALIDAVMDVFGVKDVTFSVPTGNVSAASSQALRTAVITLTVT